ncbi:MAG TPA: hypothetical protein VMT18_04925, partial [Planctomycetota bacterium]|nr:hypothetical protein [Planctomycetota bacterium]
MSEAARGVRGLRPGPPLAGVLRAPGSKSLAQRGLLCALVARGRTRMEGLPVGLPEGEDVHAARALVGALTDVAHAAPGVLEVEGRAAGELDGAVLDAGESGTLARLGLGLLALAGRPGERFVIAARGSLLGRDAAALRAALARAGVT